MNDKLNSARDASVRLFDAMDELIDWISDDVSVEDIAAEFELHKEIFVQNLIRYRIDPETYFDDED